MIIRITLCLFFCVTITLCAGGALPDAWGNAKTAYEKDAYEQAALSYEQLISAGYSSAALYHNLGLCYAQTEQWGKAVLAFERALWLDPDAAGTLKSLELVREELTDQIGGFEEYPLFKRLRNPQNMWSSRIWAFAGVLAFWLALAVWLSRRRISHAFLQRLGGTFAMVIAFFGVILLAIGMYSNHKETDWRWAVVMTPESVVYQAPDERSKEQRLIHEGVKVYVLEKIDSWSKVQLENGDEGWMKSTGIEQILPAGTL